ncbi:MAG TPA: hypothetical protein VFZ66_13585 [Herpetosiphonaceae bacterium]
MRRQLIGVMILLGTTFSLSVVPVTAQPRLPASTAEPTLTTRVVVAEDKTVESQGMVWDAVPHNQRPCPPGSVIFTREMTYGEAQQARIQHYGVLTRNPARDRDAVAHLAASVRREQQQTRAYAVRPAATCSLYYGRLKGGSYLSDPNNVNSIRISYEVAYDIFATCEIRNMRNRAKISATSGVTWERIDSVVNNVITQSRGYNLPLTDNYAAWYPGLNAMVGNTYAHVSYIGWSSARPFG